MATLAENFLADLDELSEGEEEEQQQQQQEDEKEEEEKGNGDDKVCLFSSSSVFDAAVALSLARSLASGSFRRQKRAEQILFPYTCLEKRSPK